MQLFSCTSTWFWSGLVQMLLLCYTIVIRDLFILTKQQEQLDFIKKHLVSQFFSVAYKNKCACIYKLLIPPRLELGTFCVLGRRDNRYTTESYVYWLHYRSLNDTPITVTITYFLLFFYTTVARCITFLFLKYIYTIITFILNSIPEV